MIRSLAAVDLISQFFSLIDKIIYIATTPLCAYCNCAICEPYEFMEFIEMSFISSKLLITKYTTTSSDYFRKGFKQTFKIQ